MPSDDAPPVLWAPDSKRVADATLTRYTHWLRSERDLQPEGYEALWRWSTEEIEEFWASIWDFFEVEAERPYETVLESRRMPGAQWFTGARLSYAQHIFRGKDDSAARDPPRLRAARAGHVDVGAAAARGGRDRGGAAGAGRRGGRPGGGLHAQHPRDGGRLPRLRVDRGDLVVGRARVRRPQRDRPLRADRAQGDAGRRRVPLRGQGPRPPRGGARRSRSRSGPSSCPSATWTAPAGRPPSGARTRSSSSRSCPSTIRCGSSTRRAPPGCPRRSCTARAASCSST